MRSIVGLSGILIPALLRTDGIAQPFSAPRASPVRPVEEKQLGYLAPVASE